MNEASTPALPPLPKSQPSLGKRYRTIIKLIGVGVLIVLLLVPLQMITGVLSDRLNRRNEAVADITSSWGKQQSIVGPVLMIPYQYRFDRRWISRCLHLSLHYVAATGLRAADGRNRALHRTRSRDVCDAEGGLVRARHGLEFYRQLRGDELFALLKRRVLVTEAVLNFRL